MGTFLLILILLIACVVVGVMAKNGAEREMRSREERWARAPLPAGGQAFQDTAGSRRFLPGDRPAATRSSSARVEPSPTRDGPQRSSRPRSVGATAAGAERSVPAQRARSPVDTSSVNLNEATAEEIRNLPGVGMRAAERIVAHRETYGRFASVDDLQAVEGFDHHRVSRLASHAAV